MFSCPVIIVPRDGQWSVVFGAGSALRDGQWSVERAVLQEMVSGQWSGQCSKRWSVVSGAGSAAGDGQWSMERAVLQEMVGGQWRGQCSRRWSVQRSVERAVLEYYTQSLVIGAANAGDGHWSFNLSLAVSFTQYFHQKYSVFIAETLTILSDSSPFHTRDGITQTALKTHTLLCDFLQRNKNQN